MTWSIIIKLSRTRKISKQLGINRSTIRIAGSCLRKTQPDSSYCRTVRFPGFRDKDVWPRNSPDLNPMDCSVWSTLEHTISVKRYTTLDVLKKAQNNLLYHVDIIRHFVDKKIRRVFAWLVIFWCREKNGYGRLFFGQKQNRNHASVTVFIGLATYDFFLFPKTDICHDWEDIKTASLEELKLCQKEYQKCFEDWKKALCYIYGGLNGKSILINK